MHVYRNHLASWGRRRAWRMWACLALLWVAFAPLAVRAQAPVTMQIAAGYQAHYRTNQWFPISVTLANAGPDINGTLEWRFPGQIPGQGGDRVFRRAVDLPQGANKRLTLAAFSNSFARTGELRLLSGTTEVQKQAVQIEPGDPSQFMIGVLSSDPALLNSLSALRMVNSSSSAISHLVPQDIPDEAATLMGLDVIFVHDLAANALTEQQRNALTLWVRLGGQLVFGGGPSADPRASGFDALLPVDIGDLRSGVSLAALQAVPRTAVSDAPPNVTANAVQVRAGATALDRDNLLVSRPEGTGQVLFSAFDLAALRTWSGETALWERALMVNQRFLPGAVYRQQQDNLLQSVLQLPALSLPGFGSLLTFVMCYILVIGPINYLVLKRSKRPELAWLTIPATVVLFVLGTYFYGVVMRGGQAQVSQLAVVQAVEGQPQGQATAFVGFFSPRRSSYDLLFPAESLVSEVRSGDSSGTDSSVLWQDTGTAVNNVLIDVSSLRTFMYEQATDVPIRVGSALERNAQRISGQVTNQSGEALEDALLVVGDAAQSLGTLAPGASASVDLRVDRSNFPNGVTLASTEGIFNRRNVLTSLFTLPSFGSTASSGFQQGFPDRNGVYLLGWRAQPAAPVTVNGRVATQQGLTLYIVQLHQ